MPVFVDSNIILDTVNRDVLWLEWSMAALEKYSAQGLMINAMVYAELSCNANSSKEVDELLTSMELQLAEIPREALFLASKAHLAYRRRGGSRTSCLPDFFVGAHAEILGIPILTRDQARYKTYFPSVTLICP